MAKKSKTSKLSIDSDVQSNGNGKRLHMKWKSVPLWYVVFLSIFTLSDANGSPRWNKLSAASSFLKPKSSSSKSVQEMSIIPYHASLGSKKQSADKCLSSLRGGSAAVNPFPSGYNPFGYGLTDLGRRYLKFNDGSADTDVGRFLSTLKSGRKKEATIKEQWLEIVRVSKKGQNMRIYRTLEDIIDFCLKAGFID